MSESVQTPAAVAATVGQREAPKAPPPKNTGPQPAEGAEGRPTGKLDSEDKAKQGDKNKDQTKEQGEQAQDGDTEGAAVVAEVAGPEEAAAAAQGIRGNSRDALKVLAGGVRRTKERERKPRPLKDGETKKHITEDGLDIEDAKMDVDSKNEKLPPARRALAFDYRIARLQMQTTPTQSEIAKVKAALAADDAAAADKKMTTDQRAAQEAHLQRLNERLADGPEQIQTLQEQRAALEGSDQIPNQFEDLARRLCPSLGISEADIQNNPLGSLINSVDMLRNIPPENSKARAKFFKDIEVNFPDKKELEALKRVAGMRLGHDRAIDIMRGSALPIIFIIALILEAKRRNKAKG